MVTVIPKVSTTGHHNSNQRHFIGKDKALAVGQGQDTTKHTRNGQASGLRTASLLTINVSEVLTQESHP